jgi:hypothetical protein
LTPVALRDGPAFVPDSGLSPAAPAWARKKPPADLAPLPGSRLRQLEQGLAREVGLQREDDGLLLFRERKQYLRAVQEALAGAEDAAVVLGGVVRRMERG